MLPTTKNRLGVNMKIVSAVGAAVLATALHSLPASATGQAAYDQKADTSLHESEYGETLPPIGYVNFCATNKLECAPYSMGEKLSSDRMGMTPDRWNMLYQVNTYVNGKIKPVSDEQLYGEAELWAYPTTAGDCEDFVLLKKRALEKLGVQAKNLQITVVLDEHSEGHAVLTVATEDGDYILDNRRNDILLWNDTNYTFLKRQSAKSPKSWVALLKKPDAAARVATAQKP
jgi:predicted transglutaminase-like cysteine proteinase